MQYRNSYEGIDGYAVWLIKDKARQLVGKYGFKWQDLEDIEQEIMTDLFARMGKFDPNRAGMHTFMARIVEHKVASIIEGRKAVKHNYRVSMSSLNLEIEDEDGKTEELGKFLDEEGQLNQGKSGGPNKFERESDLRMDMDRIIAGLAPELREICERLKTKSVTEVSEETGIPRATTYDQMKKVLKRFEDEGLREYL